MLVRLPCARPPPLSTFSPCSRRTIVRPHAELRLPCIWPPCSPDLLPCPLQSPCLACVDAELRRSSFCLSYARRPQRRRRLSIGRTNPVSRRGGNIGATTFCRGVLLPPQALLPAAAGLAPIGSRPRYNWRPALLLAATGLAPIGGLPCCRWQPDLLQWAAGVASWPQPERFSSPRFLARAQSPCPCLAGSTSRAPTSRAWSRRRPARLRRPPLRALP
jgi:hypothetical protein